LIATFLIKFYFFLIFPATNQNSAETIAKIKGLTQKGNLFCKGTINSFGFTVENENSMNVLKFISDSTNGSITNSEKTKTKRLFLDTLRSLSKENTIVKVYHLKYIQNL